MTWGSTLAVPKPAPVKRSSTSKWETAARIALWIVLWTLVMLFWLMVGVAYAGWIFVKVCFYGMLFFLALLLIPFRW